MLIKSCVNQYFSLSFLRKKTLKKYVDMFLACQKSKITIKLKFYYSNLKNAVETAKIAVDSCYVLRQFLTPLPSIDFREIRGLVHGSSTTVQNRVQCKENSTRSNENLSISKLINTAINVKLLKSKVTLNAREKVKVTHETEGDLGNESKVNETCYSETCHNSSTEKNKQNSTALPNFNNTHASIVKELLPLPSTRPYNNFSRSRSRSRLAHKSISNSER
jgi:hypothetical protein